jgi:GDPmannose 4,6-dehydratase
MMDSPSSIQDDGDRYDASIMTVSSGHTALITGVGGQDGIYLARFLLDRGYRVVGTLRPGSGRSAARKVYLAGVEILDLDLLQRDDFSRVLEVTRPDEIYNLAGFTSVGASWRHAEVVAETNGLAVLRILEQLVAFRERHRYAPKYFQPSSSEMFGTSDHQPQTEGTAHHPRSPYAATKSFAHHLTINYRESYDLFTCTGTLYNHESPLRGEQFVTRKITRAAAEIALGRADSLTLGNLDVRRDWGFAGDYVRAMFLALQQRSPQDFIIATGRSRALSDVLDIAFAAAGLGNPDDYLNQDPALMRPADVPDLYGDPTKAREQLAWQPTHGLESIIEHMVHVDIQRLRSGTEEHLSYLYPAG